MARPIWKGGISFGLVYIPVTLFSAESGSEIHFHLLDSHNNARIRYQKINEITGKEVPWKNIVKAYEFEKGNFVIIKESEFEKTASYHPQTVDIQSFIDQKSLENIYFEKPYYLVPSKQGIKAYVLLRETLLRTKKVGVSKVLIRTKQHLSIVMPYKNSLILNLLRFPEEIRNPKEFELPDRDIKSYQISSKELDMAEELVKTMTIKWDPKIYHDENHDILMKWIDAKIKNRKSVTSTLEKPAKAGKLVDFMEVLKKSIQDKKKSNKPLKVSKTKKKEK